MFLCLFLKTEGQISYYGIQQHATGVHWYQAVNNMKYSSEKKLHLKG